MGKLSRFFFLLCICALLFLPSAFGVKTFIEHRHLTTIVEGGTAGNLSGNGTTGYLAIWFNTTHLTNSSLNASLVCTAANGYCNQSLTSLDNIGDTASGIWIDGNLAFNQSIVDFGTAANPILQRVFGEAYYEDQSPYFKFNRTMVGSIGVWGFGLRSSGNFIIEPIDSNRIFFVMDSSGTSLFTVQTNTKRLAAGQDVSPDAQFDITNYNGNYPALIAQNAVTQNDNNTEWKTSAGVNIASIAPDGAFTSKSWIMPGECDGAEPVGAMCYNTTSGRHYGMNSTGLQALY